ncbi:MAG: HlyD family efflux transporter periplasmic adaptor subunit [Tepidiformaceae bacterium]
MATSDEYSEGSSWLRRSITLVVLVAVLGGAAYGSWYYFLRDSAPAAAAVTEQDATVTTGNLVTSFTTTGAAAASLTSKLTFAASGQVESVSVALGDTVTSGQELARLDDKDAQRKLATAQSSVTTAQLKLQQLTEPPAATDIASAEQGVSSAQGQLAGAQSALAKATAGPSDTDLSTADAAITSAQNAVTNANNQVNTSFASLISAQRNYCANGDLIQSNVCLSADIPLSLSGSSQLNSELRHPFGTTQQQSTISQAISSLLSANTSYNSALASVVTAGQGVTAAQAKKQALYDPPSALDLSQLQTGVNTAQLSVTNAQAKLAALLAGPAATDIALQQQSVDVAQIAFQTQLDAMNDLVLRAPFDGVIGAVGVSVGDQATAATAAFTLTAPEQMRIDLTVSETDLPGLKLGQFGLATFDALPGDSYILKVTAISNTPTVTQGIVTYPVQAEILRAADLQKDAAELQPEASALLSLRAGATGTGAFTGSGAAGTGAAAAGAGAARGTGNAQAGRTPIAGRTPGAGRTPAAGTTPGANGAAGAGGGAGGGTAILQALGNAPLPAVGMSANVSVLLTVKENSLLVPTGAIKRQGRTEFVIVKKDDGTTEQVTVTTGGSDATNTDVLTGLTAGEKVVLGAAPVVKGAATPTVVANGAGRVAGGAGGFGGATGRTGAGGAAGAGGGAAGGGAAGGIK